MLPVRARRLVVLLAALTALVLTGCAGVTTTSGPAGGGAQNRVWAFTPAAQLLAPPTRSQSSCSRPGFTDSAAQVAAGFCVAPEDGSTLLHYTTADRAEQIIGDGEINPSADGNTYLTPDRYTEGSTAQSRLSMGTKPEGYIEVPRPAGAPGPSVVDPFNGQPGGGLEVPVPGPVAVPPGSVFTPF
jgi:hypothetical protein